jgi:hypothetical protein
MAVSTSNILDTTELAREIHAVLGMTRRQFALYIRIDKSELDRVMTGGAASPELVYRILRGIADARRGRP